MKGKLTNKALKTIMIIVAAILVFAAAVTGTVIFLKDSGEASATEGEELAVLPVAGTDDEINNNPENTIIETEEEQQLEIQNPEEQEELQNNEEEEPTETSTEQTETDSTPAITTPQLPEETIIEQERVISQNSSINWSGINLVAGLSNIKSIKLTYLKEKDTTAPNLEVDYINKNDYSNTQNPQIHATDANPFTITVKLNGKTVREDKAVLNDQGIYSSWFGIEYLSDGKYEVIATDESENTKTINFTLDREAPELVVDTITEKDGENYSNTQNPQIHATDVNPFTITVKLNGKTVREDKAVLNDQGIYSSWFGIEYLSDGKYEVIATDAAGNTKIINFTLDREAPRKTSLRMTGGRYIKDEAGKTIWYATTADKIVVYVAFDEELEVLPKLKINGTVEKELSIRATNGEYYAIYTVNDNELKEGPISIEISGYADKAGNVGNTLTNKDITLASQGEIIIDRIAPALVVNTITEKDGENYSNTQNPQIHATDVNPFTITVKLNGKTVREDKAVLNDQGIYSSWFGIEYLSDGKYEVIATDAAGNTKTIDFTLDREAPRKTSLRMTGGTYAKNEEKGKVVYYAKDGDTITVYAKFNEDLGTLPKLNINGNVVDFTGRYDNGEYYVKYTVDSKLAEGAITIEISGYADKAGNVGNILYNTDITVAGQSEVIIDREAPALVVDTITEKDGENYSNTQDPQVHATDVNPFTITVKLNGKVVREDKAKLNSNGIYSSWCGIGYLADDEYEVIATDVAGNTKTINFILDRTM